MSSIPAQKPGRSKQNYQTPPAFLYAIRAQIGTITIDLAADGPNVCDRWFGPGSPLGEDAFEQDWAMQVPMGGQHVGWLNPPYGSIAPWARKCVAEAARGARIVMLTPDGLGTNWFCDIVQAHALTLVLRPRLTFVGETSSYPKDLAVHLFGAGMVGIGTWRWTETTGRNTEGRKAA